MDSFLELSVSLRVLPELYTVLLKSQEWKFLVQENVGGVVRLTCTSLGSKYVNLGSWKEKDVDAWALELKIHRTNHLNLIQLCQAP